MAQRQRVLWGGLIALGFSSCCFGLTSAAQPSTSTQAFGSNSLNRSSCLRAAHLFLGPQAEVVKCGSIHDSALEVVAIARVRGLREDRYGIPISKLVILKRQSGRWVSELNINEEITNEAGYVGIEFIDDAHSLPYYRLKTSDSGATWGDRQPSQFTLVLRSMSREGKMDPEDLGIGIGWNSAASRFQEIDPSGEHFTEETKKPKHFRAQ